MGRSFSKTIMKLIASVAAFSAIALAVLNLYRYMTIREATTDAATSAFIVDQFVISNLIIFFVLLATLGILGVRRSKILTDRQKMLESMHRAIELRENAIDAYALVSKLDAKGAIMAVNDKFVDCLGYDASEILGRRAHTLIDPSSGATVIASLRTAMSEGKVWTGVQQIVAKNGVMHQLATTCLPELDAKGNITQFIEIRTDITELRQVESRRLITTAMEELQDAVYIYALDTLKICYANRMARGQCGWTEKNLRTKRIHDTAATFDESVFRRHVAPLVSGELPLVTIELMSPNGPVEISTRLTDGLDGQTSFLSVVRDLSWRKKVENEKLRSVSMISHELRTPLTSIHGALRLLRSGAAGHLDEKMRGVVDIADRNTDRLMGIVNDILDYEKMSADKMDFACQELDLTQVLRDVCDLMQGYADEHDVGLNLDLDLDRAIVIGQSERIIQVMTNLVSNAVKYSDHNHTVTIALKPHSSGLRVSVRDCGPGISADQLKVLFKPFAQVTPLDGRKRQGTGLGLAIVTNILQRLDYPLSVESSVGEGTVFSFDIPSHKVIAIRDRAPVRIVS